MIIFLVSFLLSLSFAPFFIQLTKKFQFRQLVREDGPSNHAAKSGTPTLGGIIFLFPFIFTALTLIDPTPVIYLLILLTIGNGLIGFADDFIKVYLKRNLGLRSKQKLVLQILLSSIFLYFLQKQGIDTSVVVPGTDILIELSYFYYLFVVFLIVGTTNSTNLTDGLDGLLTGTAIFALSAFGLIAYLNEQTEILLFTIALGASLLGFWFFNRNPAKIFMGDTGSLAIGGALAGLAILMKLELLLVVIGFVFVMETLSVIIQVVSFKTRKKRVFKMSPIHHHYELSGYSEKSVVFGFYIVGFIAATIGVLLTVI